MCATYLFVCLFVCLCLCGFEPLCVYLCVLFPVSLSEVFSRNRAHEERKNNQRRTRAET